MPRASRRLTAFLLWIAIALLPLRGMASTWMAHEPSAPVAASASAESAPCHAAHDDNDNAGTPSLQTCAMCDLCHFAAVHPDGAAALPTAPPADKPRAAAPASIEPRSIDGPYRPPRIDLA